MQCLYTITSYPPAMGGAQIHHHSLIKQLKARHSIQVLSHWDSNRTDWLLGTTLKAPSISRDYWIEGIPVHRIGLSNWDKLKLTPYIPIYYPLMSIALSAISKLLQEHLHEYARKADLIHNVRIGREGLSHASLQLARHFDVPFILTPVHHPRWVGWRYHEYIQIYQQADAVIVLTQAEKKNLIRLGVQESRIHVTGIAPVLATQADGNDFRKKHNIQGPIVLFLGQHYPYKGYRQLLEAAPLVWNRFPDTNFVFIGPAVQKSEQVFTQFSDPRIYRLGQVNLQEKTNALKACTLLCLPSSQESFGGVYTEAWSFGKPVIGCNIPAVSDVITDGVDGYLLDQVSEPIAECISYLLLHPDKAEEMGLSGKNKVKSKYAWSRLAEMTEAVYRHVLDI